MRIGMMQPYFFPYLGYFGLIHATDQWVVFDTPQYIRRGWVNRNRVLSAGADGWKYARIPVASCGKTTAICDVRIANRQDWQRDFFNSLETYRLRKAPYYQSTLKFLHDTLSLETDSLSDLLVHSLRSCCHRLQLPFHSEQFSKMNLDVSDVKLPGDWALVTSQALQASEYVNPPGGEEIFVPQKFQQANVQLKFLQPTLPAYDQGQPSFLPGLSIIDALMWNHPSDVREMAADYKLTEASKVAA